MLVGVPGLFVGFDGEFNSKSNSVYYSFCITVAEKGLEM